MKKKRWLEGWKMIKRKEKRRLENKKEEKYIAKRLEN